MDQELDTLAERTRQLVALAKRLADDNARLRADLTASREAREALAAQAERERAALLERMEQERSALAERMAQERAALANRMQQARARVETALSRLPAPAGAEADAAPDQEH